MSVHENENRTAHREPSVASLRTEDFLAVCRFLAAREGGREMQDPLPAAYAVLLVTISRGIKSVGLQPCDAEDVSQEVLIRVPRIVLDSEDTIVSVPAYFFRAARNEALAMLRRPREATFSDLFLTVGDMTNGAASYALGLTDDVRSVVRRRLPGPRYDALVRVLSGEITAREAAVELGISEARVSQLRSLVIEALRVHLEDFEDFLGSDLKLPPPPRIE